MDQRRNQRRNRRRRRRRNQARASSSFKAMDFSGPHRFETPLLTKAHPPFWGIRPRTESLQGSEATTTASPRASMDFTRDQILQDSQEKTKEEVLPGQGAMRPGPSPVVLLSLRHPGLRFRCERPHGGAVRGVVALLELGGRVFEGCGRSRGAAKARAAACALRALGSVGPGSSPGTSLWSRPGSSLGSSLWSSSGSSLRSSTGQQLPQLFAESICGLVTEKYRELSLSSSSSPHPHHPPVKGLAGIVMTTDMDLSSAQVVALATGTKYRSLDDGEDDGLRVGDGHAEVLCRRALLRFFYDQLELLLQSPSDAGARSVFVPVPGGGAVFRLRDHVHLHMFLSCPPCGDARLHWPYHSPAHKMPTKKWRCGVRVKVHGGEGTVPCSAHRDRQHKASVSCTDKMAKWCVVGLQGALLSHLVEPIYLHSVTIATQSHPGHMDRVMWQRLAPVKRLRFPYRRRPFLLGCVGPCHLLAGGQGAHVSMSWTYGQGSEVINMRTGLQARSEAPSRLCPRAMLLRWAQLYSQISGEDAASRMSTEQKETPVWYQLTLEKYRKGLQKAGLQEEGLQEEGLQEAELQEEGLALQDRTPSLKDGEQPHT
ncbi:hypothetical protein NL108_017618 [Boleophthalmus pectinirostris]|nr:hypothetical protein NL108_017618 [Boleophthalmus pectinirostris]